MSVGKVSIWNLTPEQVKNYVPGMKLGRPDRIVVASKIEQPVAEQTKEEIRSRQQRSIKSRDKGKTVLTEELFKAGLDSGMTEREIATKYGIQHSTLTHYKSLWRRKKAKTP